jgi:hypothetical protein
MLWALTHCVYSCPRVARMENNNLSGSIPAELGNLRVLRYVVCVDEPLTKCHSRLCLSWLARADSWI